MVSGKTSSSAEILSSDSKEVVSSIEVFEICEVKYIPVDVLSEGFDDDGPGSNEAFRCSFSNFLD